MGNHVGHGYNGAELEFIRVKSAFNVAFWFREWLLRAEKGKTALPYGVSCCLKRHGLVCGSRFYRITDYGLYCLGLIAKWGWGPHEKV